MEQQTIIRATAFEDADLIREAAALTREFSKAKPGIYWPDLLASALLGYAGLYLAITGMSLAVQLIGAAVAIVLLYRSASFIHEITHMKRDHVPGFRWAWNALVGIPMMIPSFVYEDTHNQHHSKMRYGTARDPEYLPLALMKPYMLCCSWRSRFLVLSGFCCDLQSSPRFRSFHHGSGAKRSPVFQRWRSTQPIVGLCRRASSGATGS